MTDDERAHGPTPAKDGPEDLASAEVVPSAPAGLEDPPADPDEPMNPA